jgi:glycogen(starch) synthase
MGDGKASQPVTSEGPTDLRLAKPIMREIPQKSGGGSAPATQPQQPAPAQQPPPLPTMERTASPGAPGAAPAAAAPPAPPLLFEVAWEVCWQLGGIYTVLRSKAGAMLRHWDDRYFLIGPYNPATAAIEFEERPTEGFIRQALDRLREAGMPCHYGHWLVPGRPRVILLDYRARFGNLDTDKYLMWADHGISTTASDGEVNEVIAFGFAVAEFFRALTEVIPGRRVIGHFHEWMGAVAVPRIAHLKYPVTTVFTTHATLLGRYLASGSPNFYEHLPFLDPDKEAAHYNIYTRFAIERAAAHASNVFTTVSEVTAIEADKLLGRTPDAILPNGLNIQRFAAIHEFQNLHRQYKERINEFVMGHFFPAYTFDLDNTLYFFTSGRYEYGNKGFDLFIEALHRLNHRLRGIPDRPTIVAFIVTRAQTKHINVSALQSQSMFEDLKNTCADIEQQMGRRLYMAAATGRLPTYQELLVEDDAIRLKRAMHAWRTSRWPTIVTHDLADDANDPVIKHLRHRNLINGTDDPVKIVYHPEFVTATSPLLNLDYEQFVRGCHLGVFPSYYEPWGYTPMESVALGVPAIATDLSGFGAYVMRHAKEAEESGLWVLHRRQRGFEQAADELAEMMFRFTQLNRRQRIELRNRVERLSQSFDWSELVKYYHEAHQMALERTTAGAGKIEVRMV